MAGCKPNCCTQPRAAPWGNDVALIKVSRSVRAACIMRGNAPWGIKGINGLRAFGAWHFCAGAKMPNVSIAVYVPPRALPWAMGNIWAYSPPQSFTGRLCNWFIYMHLFLTFSTALSIARTSSALHSLEQTFAYSLGCEPKNL